MASNRGMTFPHWAKLTSGKRHNKNKNRNTWREGYSTKRMLDVTLSVALVVGD